MSGEYNPYSPERRDFETVVKYRTDRIILVLDMVVDFFNIQCCLRSADACGIQNVWIVLNTVKMKNRDISCVQFEAVDLWLTLRFFATTADLIQALEEDGREVWATTQSPTAVLLEAPDISCGFRGDDDSDHDDDEEGFHEFLEGEEINPYLEVPSKLAIVMGREVDGVSMELISIAKQQVFLPMYGFSESYNVSVATGLVLHRLFALCPQARGMLTNTSKEYLIQCWENTKSQLPEGNSQILLSHPITCLQNGAYASLVLPTDRGLFDMQSKRQRQEITVEDEYYTVQVDKKKKKTNSMLNSQTNQGKVPKIGNIDDMLGKQVVSTAQLHVEATTLKQRLPEQLHFLRHMNHIRLKWLKSVKYMSMSEIENIEEHNSQVAWFSGDSSTIIQYAALLQSIRNIERRQNGEDSIPADKVKLSNITPIGFCKDIKALHTCLQDLNEAELEEVYHRIVTGELYLLLIIQGLKQRIGDTWLVGTNQSKGMFAKYRTELRTYENSLHNNTAHNKKNTKGPNIDTLMNCFSSKSIVFPDISLPIHMLPRSVLEQDVLQVENIHKHCTLREFALLYKLFAVPGVAQHAVCGLQDGLNIGKQEFVIEKQDFKEYYDYPADQTYMNTALDLIQGVDRECTLPQPHMEEFNKWYFGAGIPTVPSSTQHLNGLRQMEDFASNKSKHMRVVLGSTLLSQAYVPYVSWSHNTQLASFPVLSKEAAASWTQPAVGRYIGEEQYRDWLQVALSDQMSANRAVQVDSYQLSQYSFMSLMYRMLSLCNDGTRQSTGAKTSVYIDLIRNHKESNEWADVISFWLNPDNPLTLVDVKTAFLELLQVDENDSLRSLFSSQVFNFTLNMCTIFSHYLKTFKSNVISALLRRSGCSLHTRLEDNITNHYLYAGIIFYLFAGAFDRLEEDKSVHSSEFTFNDGKGDVDPFLNSVWRHSLILTDQETQDTLYKQTHPQEIVRYGSPAVKTVENYSIVAPCSNNRAYLIILPKLAK